MVGKIQRRKTEGRKQARNRIYKNQFMLNLNDYSTLLQVTTLEPVID
jgi:hypothetical protein